MTFPELIALLVSSGVVSSAMTEFASSRRNKAKLAGEKTKHDLALNEQLAAALTAERAALVAERALFEKERAEHSGCEERLEALGAEVTKLRQIVVGEW